MSVYKLYYFNVRGRGEICRLAFEAANIEYEDIRLDGEDWVKEKESGRPPLGQIPFIITPEGKILGQSNAIAKFICKQGGLSPSDSFDEAIADMISDGVEDVVANIIEAFMEKDEDKKVKLQKDFFENIFPAKLRNFESLLKERNEGKGFFLGDEMTYADITFFNMCNAFAEGKPIVPKQLSEYPLLVEHYERVLNVPQIKGWIEKRPKTDH
ncbi:unnamed protein product [Porites lobata]|uniref:Uncharacterized protein n=1 Tax=Porites lobata TaxID=104759 RepID=A0ABN8S307_9CNID|nr:unnamed protein product [Porites lobata]